MEFSWTLRITFISSWAHVPRVFIYCLLGGIGLEVITIKKMILYGGLGIAEANYYT